MAGGRIKHFVRIVLAGWLLSAMPAAAPAQDSQTCAGSSGDAGIAICTREITSGKYTGPNLARRYYNRGVSYSAKEDNDRAIADYSEAIRLDPTLYPPRINRGLIHFDNNDHGRAITDFSEAIRLNPKQALAFFNRGYVYAIQGDADRAIPDLSEAIRLDSSYTKSFLWRGYVNSILGNYDAAASDLGRVLLATDDAYAALWHFLANWRTGKQSAMAFEVFASKLKPEEWPYPGVQLFLGRNTPEQVLAAAGKPNERCEAQFYIGAWHVLRGERVAASAPLRAAYRHLSKMVRGISRRAGRVETAWSVTP
jgi:tetratricopeptide (TPR) repeat protein